MIKIQKYCDVEDSFFDGRDFGGSIDVVKDILSDVKKRGDDALFEYGAKFDVSSPSSLEIPSSELKNAAEKICRKQQNPHCLKYTMQSDSGLYVRF